MNDTDLEKKLDAACSGITLREPRDLWPGVRAGITSARGAAFGRRSAWAAGLAAVAVIVVLSIPGAAQSIKDGLRRLFSSAYSVTIGGREASGTLISMDGEEKEIRSGDMLLRVRVSSFDEKMAKVELSVFYEGRQPDGSMRKLVSRPTVLTMKGRAAEVTVTNNAGKPVYKFRIVPTEADPDVYSGDMVPIN
ncbi:MAG: hypothetical protein RDU13_12500 [Elusimicrobiales bacterium]|nr:hypothetical protein [Elusimicrobiales bacterium]